MRGAPGQLLGDEGSLGSSSLAVLAPDRAGPVQGPCALWSRRPLEGEAAEAPRSFVARARRGALQGEGWRMGGPSGADELGDAVQLVLIEVVDWAVADDPQV